MHSSSSHRARIIAGTPSHTSHTPATPPAELRRQAELFRLLRAEAEAEAGGGAGADVTQAESEQATALEAPVEPDVLHALADEREPDRDDGNPSHDGSGDDGGHEPEHSEDEAGPATAGHAVMHAPVEPHILAATAAHRAHTVAQYAAPVAAADAPASTARDGHRLVESIVAQVADFCSNPAVLARGTWHITVPIDPALLPACTLSLTLSHFDLTLRFDTTEERSRQLVLQHATTLRESLEQVMQSRFDTARSIEIIVT